MLWQWPSPSQDEGVQVVPPLIVGSNDDAVVTGSGELYHFDAAGNQIWEEGSGIQTAAVDARGNVVALTTSGGTGDALALLTIDPAGDIAQQTVPFGATTANVFQLALAGDGTTVILLANEATAPGLTKSHVEITAVDVSGATRWTTPLDVTLPYDPATLTTHYGVFVDGSGTVVVTAGAVTGIDLATGAVLWTVQAPNAHACLRPAVLGAGGAILASQCDGTVFLARDP
jgi:outer membrane protein assembly factor BamB